MLTRDEAWALLCEWTESDRLRIHARAVELVMRDFAEKHGQNVEAYGLAGLLHDADYERWPEEHPKRIVAWLQERGEDELARAVVAHAKERTGIAPETLMEKALVASDEISGFVIACALVRPQRTEGLEPKSVHKKLRTPAFAAGVNREEVAEGFRVICEAVGGTPDEHLVRIIAAIHAHKEGLGL
jgi:predicted hydrolase (HD superfamily)